MVVLPVRADQDDEDDQAPAATIGPVSDDQGAPRTAPANDERETSTHDDGEVAACRFHWPVPVVSPDHGEPVAIDPAAAAAKRAALTEYERWDPDQGRYAIGAFSVTELIEAQRTNPTERTHAPNAPPPSQAGEG